MRLTSEAYIKTAWFVTCPYCYDIHHIDGLVRNLPESQSSVDVECDFCKMWFTVDVYPDPLP